MERPSTRLHKTLIGPIPYLLPHHCLHLRSKTSENMRFLIKGGWCQERIRGENKVEPAPKTEEGRHGIANEKTDMP